MWAPKFAFDWHDRTDEGDDTVIPPPVTANAMLRWALIVGAIALVIFVCAPKIDLAFADLFYRGNHEFLGKQFLLIPVIRWIFIIFFYLVCAVTLIGLVQAVRTGRPWLDLGLNKWLFVALCLITGPLVVANIGFKDHWGRARPRDVVEFSGAKAFTAPFPPSRQCDYNCSFVSGEASSTFIVLFAAAMLFRPYSRRFVTLGIILGGLTGLIRMAQGGHFLSDVIFAGVLMAITAASLHIFLETLEAHRATPAKPGVA
jgi:lipid A 4'-phosphatase